MNTNQIYESIEKVFSFIDTESISELKKLSGMEKKIWDCYTEIEKCIYINAKDARDWKIHMETWTKDYELSPDIIKQIAKKALNDYSVYEFTDDEVEQLIDRNSGAVNSII